MSAESLFDPLPQRSPAPWGAAASLALHLALALALILVSPLRPMIAPTPEPVAVEIVTEAEFAALQPQPEEATAPSEAMETPSSDMAVDRLPPSAALEPNLETRTTVTASEFYAERLLGEPGMAGVRRELRGLTTSERVVQLCNIEGLEQIRRAAPEYDPDTLVPYAMSPLTASGRTIGAAGGAFRSRRKWFGVAFTCTVGSDLQSVTAFEMTLGDAVPEDQWEAHDLNAADLDE